MLMRDSWTGFGLGRVLRLPVCGSLKFIHSTRSGLGDRVCLLPEEVLLTVFTFITALLSTALKMASCLTIVRYAVCLKTTFVLALRRAGSMIPANGTKVLTPHLHYQASHHRQ